MQEPSSKGEEPDPQVAKDIEELARRLREAEHLEPEVREEAADLLGDLTQALHPPEPHTEELAESTAQLVRAVSDQHEPGLIEAAKERLEEVVIKAETKAPVATDIVLRLIDVLAGIGI
ncbi:hypothetical protein [Singulisphaera acidiphila]|uniref:DUF4404 family protein n=1 Tax=Singulisphaera acidiphila (strain ATCC BAA-1392 / DSM 18658 / VKM B-2454 / MOB10) TaxID=886293 RepID=L0DT72_SINAD|nr:hypothetical protein [Singulisphaera acidiphila]AGA31566.1 hypothetical protein Sinac_7533 [Singulisphaera acidiphila DSM 18658]